METSRVNKSVFSLEGNIGAGKSTLLKVLGKRLDVDVLFEPTEKWRDVGAGGNILNLFYQDTKRWAYTFQSYAFVSRVQSIIDQQRASGSKDVQILDRSVYCDRYCFALNCFEAGLLSELEWQIYQEWFAWLVEGYTQRPSGFIYLRVEPEICFQRVLRRSDSEETGIPLAYLQSLHDKHESWLVQRENIMGHIANVPVLVLDGNKDFEHDEQQLECHIQAIEHFIEQTLGRAKEKPEVFAGSTPKTECRASQCC